MLSDDEADHSSSLRFRYLVLALGAVLTWFGPRTPAGRASGRIPGIRAARSRSRQSVLALIRRVEQLVTVPLENALTASRTSK